MTVLPVINMMTAHGEDVNGHQRNAGDGENQMERLGWKPVEFAQTLGVSRSKAYEILAANPQLTIRVGKSLRVVPERAREWRDHLNSEATTSR
jgi:hypothetical protein